MSDVFISYSRKDIAFARLLHAALKGNDLETWIDWQDIPPSTDWLAEVYEAIEQADTFVFVISELSVDSETCRLEIAHAAKHNKRLIPIVIGDIDPQIVPSSLASLNWIFFREEDTGFASAVQDLITAIQTDQAWVKGHTRHENRGLEWERKEHSGGFLLRGRDLEEAEAWLAQAGGKDPQPTALQTRYILASRSASTRRQRIVLGAVLVGLVIATALGIIAWTQRNAAVLETHARATAQAEAVAEADARATEVVIRKAAQVEAETQRDIAISRRLAVQSANHLDQNWDLALLLAIEAVKASDTLEAGIALREARFRVGRTIRVLTGHAGPVSRVVWNSQGTHILTVGEEGARIWDTEDGSEVASLPADSPPLLWADWDPAGTRIVTTAEMGARVWDVAASLRYGEDVKEMAFLNGHTGEVVHAVWNGEGSRLATSSADGTVRVWDAQTGEERVHFSGHAQEVDHAAWSPEGTHIVSSGGREAVVWDAETGLELVSLRDRLFSSGVYAAWNSDGTRVVTTGFLGHAGVWDVGTLLFGDRSGLEETPLVRHSNLVPAMEMRALPHASWNDDGSRILTVSLTGTAEIWDAQGGQTLYLSGHTEPVYYGRWDPSGERVVTSGADGARVWETQTGKQITRLTGTEDEVLDAAWNPQGTRIATAGANGEVRIWSLTPVEEIHALIPEPQERTVWNRRGTLLATSGYDTIVWDALRGEELARVGGYFALWDPDGDRLLVATSDGVVRIWDTTVLAQGEDPESALDLVGHTADVSHASWSPDGLRIVTLATDGSARLWDATSGKSLTLLELSEGAATYSEWSRSGNGLLVVHPRGVHVWDISPAPGTFESMPLRLIFEEHTDTLTHATWSPDGTRIVSTGKDGARIWGAEDGREWVELAEGAIGAPYAAWSPDGTRILTTGDTVRIWDAETGRMSLVLSGHRGPVDFAAWDATGTLILSASWDTTARIWDAFSGKTYFVVSGYFDSMRHAVWSPDNTRFVTTSWGGPVRVFDVPLGETPETACAIAFRNLTVEEWGVYLADQPYRRTCLNLP